MRAAPVGLIARTYGSSFEIGCQIAAITHGHPSGFLSGVGGLLGRRCTCMTLTPPARTSWSGMSSSGSTLQAEAERTPC